MDNYAISTYIINLPERTERLSHVLNEFKGRTEFDIHVIEACRHPIGAQGLWNSIVKTITKAAGDDDDVIIVCEDDHQFTDHYTKERLFIQIGEAYRQRCDILCGGTSGGFTCALPVTKNRFWVDRYYCNQFIVIFKSFFQIILNHTFDQSSKVDLTLSSLSANKMLIHPFVSTQKSFGYSDVTKFNEENPEWMQNRFNIASQQLETIKAIFSNFHLLQD
jgi:hypothetical protein